MKTHEIELFIGSAEDELITLVVDENDIVVGPSQYVGRQLADLYEEEADYMVEIGHEAFMEKWNLAHAYAAQADKLYGQLESDGRVKKDGPIQD